MIETAAAYLETPCLTSTPGTGGGGSSASLRVSSVGGGAATAAVWFGPMDLVLGLPLPLDLGLPGGGGRDDGAGDILFSFSSWCTGDLRTLRSRGAEADGDVDAAATTDAGVEGLFAALRTAGGSTMAFWAVEARPLVIG